MGRLLGWMVLLALTACAGAAGDGSGAASEPSTESHEHPPAPRSAPGGEEVVAQGAGIAVIIEPSTRAILALRGSGNGAPPRALLSDHPFDETSATIRRVEGTHLLHVIVTSVTGGKRASAHYLLHDSDDGFGVACVFGGSFDPQSEDPDVFRRVVTVARAEDTALPTFLVRVDDMNRTAPGDRVQSLTRYEVPPKGACLSTQLEGE